MLPFSIFSKADVSALVWCFSVLLTVISLIVFICTITYELNDDDDDDDDDDGDDDDMTQAYLKKLVFKYSANIWVFK